MTIDSIKKYSQNLFAVLMGFLLIFIEIYINQLMGFSLKYYFVLFVTAIVFSLIVLSLTKRFVLCNWMAVTVFAAIFSFVVVSYFRENSIPSVDTVFLILVNWFGVCLACFCVAFFQKQNRVSGFHQFFKGNTIAFAFIYCMIILYVEFLKSILWSTQYSSKINFIPFIYTIIPYFTGRSGVDFYIAVSNLAANILLFAPLGFYIGVFSKKISRFMIAPIGIIVPVGIESLQYLLSCGVADIDDVILNALGYFLGFLFCLGIEKAYRSYQKSREKRLFVFHGEYEY